MGAKLPRKTAASDFEFRVQASGCRLAAFAGAVMLALFTGGSAPALAQDLPAASNVVARLLERAAQVARSGDETNYVYAKRAVVEELDAEGKAIKTTEKLYQVTLIQGLPFARLVKVQGRDLTPLELQKRDKKEQEFRNKITARDPKEMTKRQEPWLTREMMDHFDYTVAKRELLEQRPTLVLNFTPKPIIPAANSFQDQILGRMAGQIWVDETDAEIALVSVHLTEPVSLGWLSLVGSLKQCDLTMRRQRTPEAVWVNQKQTLLILGRKLFSAMRFRSTEESSGFRRP